MRQFDGAPVAQEVPDTAALGLVKKRVAERTRAFAPEEAPAGNVVSIMDALRRSLSEEKKPRR